MSTSLQLQIYAVIYIWFMCITSTKLQSQSLTYYPPNGYEVSQAVYAGKTEALSLISNSDFPTGFTFSSSGDQLFITDNDNDRVIKYILSTPYDVSTAVFSQELNLLPVSDNPQEVVFNSTGSRLYVVNGNSSGVFEYQLTTNYDLSTATYAGLTESLDISGQESQSRGLSFNAEGTKLFIIGEQDDAIVEYNLSVAFDISTASHLGVSEEFSVATEDDAPQQLVFNYDGTQVFMSGTQNDSLYTYNLNIPYDISTANYESGASLAIGTIENSIRTLAFNNNGTKLYIMGEQSDTLSEFSIDPGNYPEDMANDGSIDNNTPLVIVLDGETFQDIDNDNLLDIGTEVIIQNVPLGLMPVMTLSNGDSQATLTFTGNALSHDDINSIDDITFTFSDDAFTGGDASIVTNSGNGIAFSSQVGIQFLASPSLQYILPNAFEVSRAKYLGTAEALSIASETDAANGIVFNPTGTQLFVVEETNKSVLTYTLSTPYDVSTASYAGTNQTLNVLSEAFWPHEVIFNTDGTKAFVIDDSSNRIYEYNLGTGFDLSTASYAGLAESLDVAGEEANPRGMTFNDNGSKLFLIGRNDSIVEYDLPVAFDISTAVYAGATEEFSVLAQDADPHQVIFNYDGTKMYVAGTRFNNIYTYSLSTPYDVSTAGFIEARNINDEEPSIRSIIFNPDGTKLFMTGWNNDLVHEYAIDPGDYIENSANDGTVNNSNPIVILLNGDIFQDIDNDNLLDTGTEVIINNVPTGLTPVLTLTDGDTKVTLTFSGNATDHNLRHAIDNLTFEFTDAAFVGGNTNAVSNSGNFTAYNTQVGISFLENPKLTYFPPNTTDVAKANYTGIAEEFSVASETTNPEGIFFRPDGYNMYIIDRPNARDIKL